MNRPGLQGLAAVVIMALALDAAADEVHDRLPLAEQQRVELQDQLDVLVQEAAEHGVEISDIRIQLNTKGSAAAQPVFGCTVSRYQPVAGVPGEVRLEARAPTCLEALALLDGA